MSTSIQTLTTPSPDNIKITTTAAASNKQSFSSELDDAKKEAATKEIMKNYDLHNISLEEAGSMVQDLRDAGLITFDEGSMLGMLTHAFVERVNGNKNWKEEKTDYIADTTGEVEYHKQLKHIDDIKMKSYLSLERKLEQLIQLSKQKT